MIKLKEYINKFKKGMRIKSRKTGDKGTVTFVYPDEIGVVWDDYKNSIKGSRSKTVSMRYSLDKANELFSADLDEWSDNIITPLGQNVMGTVGDASFFGPDAKMKGGKKRSVYKVPDSSIHSDSGSKNMPPDFSDELEQPDDDSKAYPIAWDTEYIPDSSIHSKKTRDQQDETVDYPGSQTAIGSVGDGSFIGKSGQFQGNSKMPIFKTPKSSIHYKKKQFGRAFDDDFYNDDNWETDEEQPYPGFRSVPKSSIHKTDYDMQLGIKPNGPEGDNYEDDGGKQRVKEFGGLGIPMSADGVIDGGPRSMDPVAKKKKYKFSKPINERFFNKKELRELSNKVLRKRFSNLSEEEIEKRKDELFDIMMHELYEKQEKEFKKMQLETDGSGTDYEFQVIPKNSVHYRENDRVQGEPMMKFEKPTLKSGFTPKHLKNLKTEGDWKSNLTKAVMDLTDEAQPEEPRYPVPKEPMGDTPEFPFTGDREGTTIYPIPDTGMVAIKKEDGWEFGNTPKLPPAAEADAEEFQKVDGGDFAGTISNPQIGSDEEEIDISCDQKPLIKKMLMVMQNEQKNLQEGISLKGIYEGKVVKLNTIFEGDHRRFKAFVKTNEGKIVKIHFGPHLNESCTGI